MPRIADIAKLSKVILRSVEYEGYKKREVESMKGSYILHRCWIIAKQTKEMERMHSGEYKTQCANWFVFLILKLLVKKFRFTLLFSHQTCILDSRYT